MYKVYWRGVFMCYGVVIEKIRNFESASPEEALNVIQDAIDVEMDKCTTMIDSLFTIVPIEIND